MKRYIHVVPSLDFFNGGLIPFATYIKEEPGLVEVVNSEIPFGKLGQFNYMFEETKQGIIFESTHFNPLGDHYIKKKFLELYGKGYGNHIERFAIKYLLDHFGNQQIKQDDIPSPSRKSQLNKIGIDVEETYFLKDYLAFFDNYLAKK